LTRADPMGPLKEGAVHPVSVASKENLSRFTLWREGTPSSSRLSGIIGQEDVLLLGEYGREQYYSLSKAKCVTKLGGA
jgi:hypothetical protein